MINANSFSDDLKYYEQYVDWIWCNMVRLPTQLKLLAYYFTGARNCPETRGEQ